MSLPLLALAAVLAKLVSAHSCDIYAAGGTPCVAAHSTTRSLYSAYSGPLYQLTRNSDNTTTDVYPLNTGGVANAGTQDTFCASTTCLISTIYDQSSMGNHLTAAPSGQASKGPQLDGNDFVAGATGAAVCLNGAKAYGVFTTSGTGYRNIHTTGVAKGNDPEGIYAVVDGTVYSPQCCFDYGNAETSLIDDGQGTMEALMFGQNTATNWVGGAGSGPWLQVDLENGAWAGGPSDQGSNYGGTNPNSPTITNRFFAGFVKGNDTNWWATRGGDATSGSLTTYWSGPRPLQPTNDNGRQYYPMQKEGSIILGIGGDNSNWAQGVFYEGAMTSGYPSDTTENAVQQDVIAAGYKTTSQLSGPLINQGQVVQLQNVASGHYLGHSGETVSGVSSSSTATQWTVVAPNSPYSGCYSFESVDSPGSYLRHWAYELLCDTPTQRNANTFNDDSTFCPNYGFTSSSVNSFRSYSFPTRFWRELPNANVLIGTEGGPWTQDSWIDFNQQASWQVTFV